MFDGKTIRLIQLFNIPVVIYVRFLRYCSRIQFFNIFHSFDCSLQEHGSDCQGNVQSVTFLKDGEEIKGFIEANPKDKTINIYDAKMEPLSKEAKQDFVDRHPGKEKQQAVNGNEVG